MALQKVFAENAIHFDVINLGQAAATGSLEEAFKQKLGEWNIGTPTSQETNSSAGLKPGGMGVDHSMKSSQTFHAKSPFMSLLAAVRFRAHGDRPAALVLDNFESIINDADMVRQIGGLIVSADDESFSQHDVQVIIIGVPGNLKDILVNISNSAPIANRLTELPEVARMTETEAGNLIEKGFVDQLELKFSQEVTQSKLYSDISFYTDRIAQHLHELCLIIAQSAVRNNGLITQAIVDESVSTWVEDSLSSDVGVIEGVMNAIDTKVGRKNQVLFALGICALEDFKTSDIESIVRDNFDTKGAALNVSQILSGFASAKHPIIRRAPKQNLWKFVTPKYRMAIRTKLKRTDDGRVMLQQS